MKRIISDSSNGSDALKNEVKFSDSRLKKVKSGIMCDMLITKKDESFFIPDLDQYFSFKDKTMRKMTESNSPKFFITE